MRPGYPILEGGTDGLVGDERGSTCRGTRDELSLGADVGQRCQLRYRVDTVLAKGAAFGTVDTGDEGDVGLFVCTEQAELHVRAAGTAGTERIGQLVERAGAGGVAVCVRELCKDAVDVAAELIGIGGYCTPGAIEGEPVSCALAVDCALLLVEWRQCRDEWWLVEDGCLDCMR